MQSSAIRCQDRQGDSDRDRSQQCSLSSVHLHSFVILLAHQVHELCHGQEVQARERQTLGLQVVIHALQHLLQRAQIADQ